MGTTLARAGGGDGGRPAVAAARGQPAAVAPPEHPDAMPLPTPADRDEGARHENRKGTPVNQQRSLSCFAYAPGSTFISLDDDEEGDAEGGGGGDGPRSRSSGVAAAERATLVPVREVLDAAEEMRALEARALELQAKATEALRKIYPHASVAKIASICGRTVVVLDGMVSPAHLENFFGYLQGDSFRRTEFARPDTREFRHLITEYNVDTFKSTPLFHIVDACLRTCFPGLAGIKVYRIYTNAITYGDVAFTHQDSFETDHVTILLYPNPEWASELGGETIFYDEGGSTGLSIEPRPGRICLFHADIQHKGSPPSRLFFGPRFTTAFKFAPDERI